MLQEYLNANLLSLTDDEDFKKLQKSADEIAKKLPKNKTKVVSYLLSAIDPNIAAENADIVEVKDIIIKNWSTFINNTKDTPLIYIRAVILEALNSISEDVNFSMLIWYTGRNIAKCQNLIGEEKRVVREFLIKLGNNINKKANEEWALSASDSLSKTTIELKEIAKYLINEDSLKKYLEDASGPNNREGKANYASPNPHWPNTGASWSYEFPSRAAKGIKNTVDACLKEIVGIINENRNIIQDSLDQALAKLQKRVADINKSLQIRSELLWWKEAGYSPSMDKSYKKLDKNILGVVLAQDYASLIPLVYPKSVDFFLTEAYKGINEGLVDELTIEEHLKLLEKNTDELKQVLPDCNVPAGKMTLLNFISGLIWGKCAVNQLTDLVGIPAKTKLSGEELTAWLFHDFQLSKVLNIK